MHESRAYGLRERWLTVHEVARVLRVATITARREIAVGKLQAVRIGRCVRVSEAALSQYMEDWRV